MKFIDHSMAADDSEVESGSIQDFRRSFDYLLADYLRNQTVKKLQDGRRRKFETGNLLPWIHPPFGYCTDPIHPRNPAGVQIKEAEATAIQIIFDLYVHQNYTFSDIIRYLHDRGLASPRGNEFWSSATLRGILQRSAYTGRVYVQISTTDGVIHTPSSKQWILAANIPPIISQADFDLAQYKLAKTQKPVIRDDELMAS